MFSSKIIAKLVHFFYKIIGDFTFDKWPIRIVIITNVQQSKHFGVSAHMILKTVVWWTSDPMTLNTTNNTCA